MVIRSFITFILCIILTIGLSQQPLLYDTNRVSNARELNFFTTEKRGIEAPNGLIYFVDKNLKILIAYQNGKIKWKSDIIEICGLPTVGKSEIRYLKLDGNKIFLVFGKHDYAIVNIADGKVKCLGSD